MGEATISDRLRALGYEHHKHNEHAFARLVLHSATGRRVALFGAGEAAKFCGALEAGADEPSAIKTAFARDAAQETTR